MKTCRKCGGEKPLTEFYARQSACKVCVIARTKSYQKQNASKVNAKNKRWREANKERARSLQAEWRKRNLEKVRKIAREWAREKRRADPEGEKSYRHCWLEKNRERTRECYREYYSRNRELCRLKNMRRRVQAPSWLTKDHKREIRDKCKLAVVLSSQGALYHVDHIWPLRGKDVWGLHVPWNLQVIPAEANYRKANKRPDHAHIMQELAACPN